MRFGFPRKTLHSVKRNLRYFCKMTGAGEGNGENTPCLPEQPRDLSQQLRDLSKQISDQNSKGFYLSLAINVFFLVIIFCWVTLQIVRSAPKDCPKSPTMPSPTSSPSVSEDSFFSCSPCKPMMKADEDETMRLTAGNSSYVCCKKINSNIKLEVPNTGQLLEKCKANANDDHGIGALMHINLTTTQCTTGLHWFWGRGTSYLRGGVQYEDLLLYGRLKVPSDGVYAIYSYIQFDSYTSKNNIDKPKPEMHVLYKNGKELVQMNKFMLRTYSYTSSQVGPLLVELKAGDSIHVAVGTMGKFIFNDPLSSVFGIYKL